MYKHFTGFLSIALVVFSSVSFGQTVSDSATTEKFDEQRLILSLSDSLGLTVSSAKKSPMPGLAEVVTDQGLFYTSFDGSFFIAGKLFKVGEQVTNLTESSLADVRLAGLDKFKQDMIVYPAKDEKHVVTVFTDITCTYCRKMHDQMDEYNAKGITIRYLAYPREGVIDPRTGQMSQGFQNLRSVWCNENPEQALTKAKAGSGVAQRICDKPVAEEFSFGRQVGVTGTPAMIFENGAMVVGYRGPEDLIKTIENL